MVGAKPQKRSPRVGPSKPERPAAAPISPGLYIVATPIGNLRDITLRALDTLSGADFVLAEDTRTTKRLFAHYGISTALEPYHEHNAAKVRPAIVERLVGGARVALVSDAGTPLVSDPGYKLVRAAVEAGVRVYTVPGASAAVAALTVAGLPSDRFLFAGFLPPRGAARRGALAELRAAPATLIFDEAGPRLGAALADMAAVLGDRPGAVARELTKLYEEVVRGPLSELAARYADAPPRGEIVVLVAPPDGAALDAGDTEVDARLAAALQTLSLRDAADQVAGTTGRPRREVYQRALALGKAARR
jgi:16S rRNA (cytidine1402-2'-O)-methyltransferase